MKKEATNSFSGGLNYDLNPITTPNNVLTDAINSTFITFNGDELALQNDAGNTKILIKNENPEAPAEYVTLTPGFYPLGIKEYGGVLYIVSCNKDAGLIEFGSYPSPEFMNNLSNTGIEYTTLKIVNNIQEIDLYSSSIINNFEFKSGRYITFGIDATELVNSKFLSYWTSQGVYVKKLYKLKLWHQLSNGMFDLTNDIWEKYLTFKKTFGSLLTTAITSATTVSTLDVNNTTNFPNSGTLWINDDQYSYSSKTNTTFVLTTPLTGKDYPLNTIISRSPNYWILDSDFKYFCPNQYKGKLALSLEIEDLDLFTLNDIPKLEYISNDNSLSLENASSFPNSGLAIIGSDMFPYSATFSYLNGIVAAGLVTELILDDVSEFPNSGEVNIGDEIFAYTSKDTLNNKLISSTGVNLSEHLDNEIVWITTESSITSTLRQAVGPTYKYTVSVKTNNEDPLVVPSAFITWYYNNVEIYSDNFTSVDGVFEGSVYLLESLYKDKVVSFRATPNLEVEGITYYYNDLPTEFTSKYSIYGEKLILLSIADVSFELVEAKKECDLSTIGMASYNVVILKNSLGQFIDETLNLSAIPCEFVLSGYPESGTYKLLKEYTINKTTGKPSIISGSSPVEVSDELRQLFEDIIVYKYSEDCDKTTLTITSNIDYMTPLVVVKQNGVTLHDVDSVYSVIKNVPITISSIGNDAFEDISETVTIDRDATINLGFVSRLTLEIQLTSDVPTTYNHIITWNSSTGPGPIELAITYNGYTNYPYLSPNLGIYSATQNLPVAVNPLDVSIMDGAYTSVAEYYNLNEYASDVFKEIIFGSNRYLFKGENRLLRIGGQEEIQL